MSLSSFILLCFVLLALSASIAQTQLWGTSIGRCWGRFERYRECASTCPDTCQDVFWPNVPKLCPMMCRIGCECIPPFVRLNQNANSPCVHPRHCRFV
ncbi:unnamed protein product [Adineta ricciae]|uniref:TIL domain-containing protein n=1 Tax=Adineta ricciae TaxID=249248 RepID=A0A815MA23_ADIRI|nr:unnamed protein product [Adineta ricciae]CAF1421708.1 unnamed protein product [Adineta ricciae]